MPVPMRTEVARKLAGAGVVQVRPGPADDRWLVRAERMVGALRVGDIELRIEPKVPVERLLFLAGYARRPPLWRDETLRLAVADGLVPALAGTLGRQADRALRPGLLQGYCTVDAAATVLRGRLRESDQMRRHPGQPLPLEIRRDDYTIDIPENQILATAIGRMLRVPGVDGQSRRTLRHLAGKLTGVSMLPAGAPAPRWQPSRINARYVTALRLAELVLAASSIEAGPGSVPTNGFLLDLPQVFEDFLAVALRQAIETVSGGRVTTQMTSHLDVGCRVTLRPDIVWSTCGQVRAVVDAKYKAHTPASDAYQMLAYCVVHGLRRGHLVYVTGDHPPTTHVVRRAGIEIVCHTLDLDQPPAALLTRIHALAADIAAGASEADSRI